MKRLHLFFLFGIIFISACSENDEPAKRIIDYSEVDTISYSIHVEPLLTKMGELLEDQGAFPAQWDISSWSSVFEGYQGGAVIIPYAANESLLIRLLRHTQFENEAPDSVELAFLERWIEEGAKNDAGRVAYQNSLDRVYVCNQADATISVIDATALVTVRVIDLQELGFSAAAKPHHIAVEVDGSAWYVSLIGENKVLKFSHDGTLLGSVDTDVPGLLVLHPDGEKLYAGRSMSAVNPPSSIAVIDRLNMRLLSEIPLVFDRPHALQVLPNGEHVFVGSLAENKIAIIDAAIDEVDDYFTEQGENAVYVHFSAALDNSALYATGQISNKLHIFNVSQSGQLSLRTRVDADQKPWHPITLPNGHVAFGNQGSNSVMLVNPQTEAISKQISGNGLAMPHGSALNDDSSYLFISNRNINGSYTPRYAFDSAPETGTVCVIDLSSMTLIKVLETGAQPSGMGG